MMRQAPIVRAPNQIHAGRQRGNSMGGMATFARERRQSLPHRPIEPFNKRGVEHCSSPCCLQQGVGQFQGPQGHLACDLNDSLLLHTLDHGGNTQVRSDL
jgi:hypothetical protein